MKILREQVHIFADLTWQVLLWTQEWEFRADSKFSLSDSTDATTHYYIIKMLQLSTLEKTLKCENVMSRLMTKPTKWYMRQAKTQISLGICTVWWEFSLCVQWVAKGPMFLHASSNDSDQTGRMPRLIWVFAGRKGHFVGFVMRQLLSCLQHLRNATKQIKSNYLVNFS